MGADAGGPADIRRWTQIKGERLRGTLTQTGKDLDSMFLQLMRRHVISNRAVAQFCQASCSVVGALVLMLGFRRLEELDLTEIQLYSATSKPCSWLRRLLAWR